MSLDSSLTSCLFYAVVCFHLTANGITDGLLEGIYRRAHSSRNINAAGRSHPHEGIANIDYEDESIR
jgi:hypothetical protein